MSPLDKALTCITDPVSVERLARLKANLSVRRVIPYVGAGMSLFAGYPSWRGLCDEIRVAAVDAGRPRPPGDDVTFPDLLEHYADHGNWLPEFISSRFRPRPIAGLLPSAPVSLLPALQPPFVVTTNYDSVLEEVLGDALDGVFTGLNIDPNMYRKLFEPPAKGFLALLKLHGSFDLCRGLVATHADYTAAYSESGHNRQLLTHLMTARSLLFLGCSLDTQDAPTRVLADLKSRLGEFAQEHFALRETPPDVAAEEARLNGLNVRPIWYKGGHDECLCEILAFLGAAPELHPVGTRAQVEPIDLSLGALPVLRWLLEQQVTGSMATSAWDSFASRVRKERLEDDLLIQNHAEKRAIEAACTQGDLGERGRKTATLSRSHPSRSLMYKLPTREFARERIRYLEVSYDVPSNELQVLVNSEVVAARELS
jgi:SIR2-like domain